ncbi:DinB family protein [Auraticoccus monumenti]|nr:DinB family protein [Auraticoccus monumenti]
MATLGSDDLRGARLVGVDLSGARLVEVDLSRVVVRGGDLADADLDAPWLLDGRSTLLVNGVDVVPYVEAELTRRFPERAGRRAEDPDGLRECWAALERTWAATVERAEAMPAGTVDVSVDGEWSFAETLRHLVLATDLWLGKVVQGREQPFSPLGLAFLDAGEHGMDLSVFTDATPSWTEVLEVRADRLAMVRDHLAGLRAEDLDAPRAGPWDPQRTLTVLGCLHTVLTEEWEHLRFAVRDLDAIAARA